MVKLYAETFAGPDAEDAVLADLNAAVKHAIWRRRQWLDVKMAETSDLQVGDEIFDLESGRKLGKVTELYRFHRDRDEGVRDTSRYCDYQYEVSPGILDNTSRQTSRSFGTREQAEQRARTRLADLIESGG